MAIDSEDKRRSAMTTFPAIGALPEPDSSMTQGDRQHVVYIYRGIAAGGAGADAMPMAVSSFRRRRTG